MRKKRKEHDEDEAAVESASRRSRVTPIDIQQKEFRQQFRGYHMGDVDGFLDELTEELAAVQEETRRLREQAASGATTPLLGAGDVAESSREAERIVADAREEAARVVAEAESRAGAFRAAGSGDLGPFLAREREFLQTLASAIQGHAESVREMARAVAARRAAEPAAEEERSPAEAPATPQPPEPAAAATAARERTEPAEAPIQPPEPTVAEPAEAAPAEAAPAITERIQAEPPPPEPEPAEPEPDIVRVDEAEEPPVGTPVTGRDAEAGENAKERSLRDLFWGED